MKINLIGMPLYYGSDIWGVNNGPNKLREAGIKKLLEKNNTVFDMGNVFIKNCVEEDKFKENNKAKYIREIVDANNDLANNVYLALKDNTFPLTIGGDHSLALGTIAGTSKYFRDDLAVIWIDAHGDFNTVDTTPSGNIHGMPLAASAGFGCDELKNVYFKGKKISTENIFILGARDLDSGEVDLLKQNNVKFWTTNEIKNLGIDKIVLKIISILEEKNVKNIHISFDIDSIDPIFIPGTGTPVKNGLNLDEVIRILNYLFETKKVRALDFVEFNPSLDTENITIDNCLRLIEVISGLIG